MNITEKIVATVYVYYHLDNFYQNHRRYVKSRSFSQLQGNYLGVDSLTECDPITKNTHLVSSYRAYADGTPFGPSDMELPAVPCGLVAKSVFNDTYLFQKKDGTNIPINEKGIAWQSDIDYKFKNVPNNTVVNNVTKTSWKQIQWIDMTDGKIHVFVLLIVIQSTSLFG